MTELLINAVAATHTSLGGKRYLEGILANLDWPTPPRLHGKPYGPGARIGELLMAGRRDALLWSPSHRGPLFARNHIVTVYDCINIEYTYAQDWRLPLLKAAFYQLLNNARRVVTISNATRDVVIRLFDIDPGKVVASPGPVSFPALAASSHEAGPAGSDFVLMISNALPHKNTNLAGRAFARSSAARRGIELRVVGTMDAAGLQACRDAGVVVRMVSGIDDKELNTLLKTCRFLWSTSLQEGLNLPIAEALSAGVNVLASDIPTHREFFEGEVALFDPRSLEAAVYALEAAFERSGPWPRATKDKVALTFQDVAQGYRRVFDELAAEIQS